VTETAGPRPSGVFKKSRELEQFKSSAVCLDLLQKYVASSDRNRSSAIDDLFRFYDFVVRQEIFWPKWDQVKTQLKEQIAAKVCEFQDDPVILHLLYAEHGHYLSKTLSLLDHVVIDEAQDFGLMEIRALLNAVDAERTMTIVGDISQKIVMGRNFNSWEEMLRDAGFEETTPIQLTVSHRSTNEIMKIASHVRQVTANHSSTRNGPVPTFIRAHAPQVVPNFVGQWIKNRIEENPNSLSAIICRWPKEAQVLVEALRQIGYPSVRLGHRDQFEFTPGVVVTNVNQVKGLEFRNVLIVEPSEENYGGAEEEERNLLYVAVTRAESRLDFIGCQPLTKFLAVAPTGIEPVSKA
ncbi:MAG: 3'-5' exonuclease, partial [Deltaproteobacteria bacterium]|nr:3'-5' exonuclease [Deltaproteobacteria bacterium]